jgi:predicted nucleic acid-binding protein
LLDACHLLDEPEDLWTEAGEVGFRLRRRGVTPKTLDLLIAIYALSHSCSVLTTDKDFLSMQKAGIPLLVVAG